jgi:hypothetical protein
MLRLAQPREHARTLISRLKGVGGSPGSGIRCWHWPEPLPGAGKHKRDWCDLVLGSFSARNTV